MSKAFDGTAVVLHLIGAARMWAATRSIPLDPEATALVAWVVELEERYAREQPAPEPVGWEPRRWREVRPGDRISVSGHEAVVESALTQAWHVNPQSKERWPSSLEHEITKVRLEGREPLYSMPPDGEVEVLRGELGQRADRESGYRSPLAELAGEPRDVIREWAWEAVQTLQAAGLEPVEVKE